jgi:alpha-tubulin suppressor-like RCC1 family protein
MRASQWLWVCLLVAACGGSSSGIDAAPVDAGMADVAQPIVDAAVDAAVDAEVPDAAPPDAVTCPGPCPVVCSAGTCAVAIEITAGSAFNCVLLDDGAVWCWGNDGVGQLGLGLAGLSSFTCSDGAYPRSCRLEPHRVVGLPPAAHIRARDEHTCAVLVDGTLRCWGRAAGLGNMHVGVTTCMESGVSVDCLRTPTGDPGLSGMDDVAPGSVHMCALSASGEVWCWGSNGFGQLGSVHFATDYPIPVPGLTGVTAIASGYYHTCVILADTSVSCWGRNDDGQIGDGGSDDQNTPTPVVGLTNAVQLALGERHSCARLSDGTEWCWGSNILGSLGNGTFTASPTPVQVSGLSGATHIAVGKYNSCATDGTTASCWGLDTAGALGYPGTETCGLTGTALCSSTPGAVGSLSNVTQTALGATHVCTLLSDGSVRCWGGGQFGALGNGSSGDHSSPVTPMW